MDVAVDTLDRAIYGRLKRDSAGSAFRALLGAGAESVVPGGQLDRYSSPATPDTALPALPARLLAVFRRGPAPRLTDLHVATFQWFLLDDPRQDYARIDAAILPLVRAYGTAPIPLGSGRVITAVEISATSGQREDTALGLLLTVVTLTVRAAGPALL